MAAQGVTLTLIFVVLLTAPMVLSREYNDSIKNPKETKFTVYLHAFRGPNGRFVPVAGIPGRPRNTGEFGTLYLADLLVTQNVSLASPEVGRAQGIQAVTSPNGTTAYNTFSILFTSREYNGSTLNFQGIARQASPFTSVSEFSVFGTKYFRSARGYALRDVVLLKPSVQYSVSRFNISIYKTYN